MGIATTYVQNGPRGDTSGRCDAVAGVSPESSARIAVVNGVIVGMLADRHVRPGVPTEFPRVIELRWV